MINMGWLLWQNTLDPEAVKAVNMGKTIVDIDCGSGEAVKEVYNSVMKLLFEEGRD